MQYKKYFFGLSLIMIAAASQAQDTSGKKVRITSSFKPVLKDAAKINLTAAPPGTDTSRPRLQYNIPNQNLVLAFQPGNLRPLALSVDSGGRWNNESYIKLGYGNFNTPFVQVGLSTGNGKTAGINVYGKHTSSKGNLPLQDYSYTTGEANAFYQSGNIEYDARIGGVQEKYNKYGFQPATLVFPKDSINVKLQTYKARVALHNINRTTLGISYAPEIKVDYFKDQLSNTESDLFINLPFHKSLGTDFGVDVAATANIAQYKPQNKAGVSTNYFTVAPSVLYKTGPLNIQAGIRPSWDKGHFTLLPNVMVEASSSDKRISFQAGWVGYLRYSGFQYQAEINPWIWAPPTVYNSQVKEFYAGIKGSTGDHLSYSAKVAYNTITNQPLFTNDTTAGGKSFRVITEPELKVINIGGEVGYTVGERFSVIANLQVNNYTTKLAPKAWGLLPIELSAALRLQVLKDLYLTTDLYAFDGAQYQLKGGGKGKVGNAFELSAGLEFKIVPNVKLWAQFNNLANQQYQRWNQYPVYGFQFLGGVVFSFAQKK